MEHLATLPFLDVGPSGTSSAQANNPTTPSALCDSPPIFEIQHSFPSPLATRSPQSSDITSVTNHYLATYSSSHSHSSSPLSCSDHEAFMIQSDHNSTDSFTTTTSTERYTNDALSNFF